ncbi:MAG: hypothetical protein JWP29_1337 [Rhodoferax sp.]|nr:hypothetical protein [Rhodoferax sp.]
MHNGTGVLTGISTDSSLQRGVNQMGTALHNSIDKVADPTRSAIDTASTKAHETVDKLASKAESAAQAVEARRQRMAEAPNRALDHARDYVTQNPLRAVGSALAVGSMLGWLNRR